MFLSHIAAAMRKRLVSCAALAIVVSRAARHRRPHDADVAGRIALPAGPPPYLRPHPLHSHLAPFLREPFPLRESTAARAIGSACRCGGQAKSLSLVACSGGIQEGHSIVVNEVREFKVPTVRARV